MPATGETIAEFELVNRLNKVLFPVFGRPISATDRIFFFITVLAAIDDEFTGIVISCTLEELAVSVFVLLLPPTPTHKSLLLTKLGQ